MKEHPILFSGPMIRAIVDGSKTQTRRIMKPQPAHVWGFGVSHDSHDFTAHVRYPGGHQPDPWVRCPYGAPPHRGEPGDHLWVRETWWGAIGYTVPEGREQRMVAYREKLGNVPSPGAGGRWKPSIHMPRWASRITLAIEAVRVERLQDISLDDMRAEGVRPDTEASLLWRETLATNFRALWDSINARRGYSWAANPYVWAITFRRV